MILRCCPFVIVGVTPRLLWCWDVCRHLHSQMESEMQEKVHVFSTFFYKRFIQGFAKSSQAGYENVKRWTSKVDVFKYGLTPVVSEVPFTWVFRRCSWGSLFSSGSPHRSVRLAVGRYKFWLVPVNKRPV